VVTNAFLIALLSPFPNKIGFGQANDKLRYQVFAVLQYGLLLIFALAYSWFGSVSVETQKVHAKHNLLSNRAVQQKIRDVIGGGRRRDDGPLSGMSTGTNAPTTMTGGGTNGDVVGVGFVVPFPPTYSATAV